MSHREPTSADFEGKTIIRANTECINSWQFWFSDGSTFVIEVDYFGYNLYGLVLCDECAKASPLIEEKTEVSN